MRNPQETLWLDRLGIGTGGKPYVMPIEQARDTDEGWPSDPDDTTGLDHLTNLAESFDLVTNA